MTHQVVSDKVVLVTGANNPLGIGAATARAFAAAGAQVFITYLRVPADWDDAMAAGESPAAERPAAAGWSLYDYLTRQPADETVESIRCAGGKAAAWEADLTEVAVIPQLLDRVESAFGPVDILINNAAHAPGKDGIWDLTAETIDRTYAVNTRAALLLIAEYLRRYRQTGKTWGRIVNLSTGPAQCFTDKIAYGTSKAAMEAATRAIGHVVAPLGITVNCIAPGPIQTGYISPKVEEEESAASPVRRIGRPEEIASAVLFLCSEQAEYITGQVIRVNGGREY